jgi:hypothetical protein
MACGGPAFPGALGPIVLRGASQVYYVKWFIGDAELIAGLSDHRYFLPNDWCRLCL